MTRKRAEPSYLKRRRLGWYVQLAVPVALQPVIGAKVLTRSLQTRDEGEARRRRHAVIAEFQEVLAAAAKAPSQAPVDALVATAQVLHSAERSGVATEEDTQAAFGAEVDRVLDGEARRLGRDAEGQPKLSRRDAAAVRRAHSMAAGRPDESISHLLGLYLAELRSDAALLPSSIQEKEVQLTDFVEWFGGSHSWRDVRRGVAVDYYTEVRSRRPKKGSGVRLSNKSVAKAMTHVRVFFGWILDRQDADIRPPNPFQGLQPPKDVRGKEPARRPWTAEELSTFLHGVPQDDPLWSLAALGAYTGARLEELASLRCDAVEGESFVVKQGKRQASVRRVPLHPVIAPLVSRLVETSPDGFVLPGLIVGGADDRRGKMIGKRFAYRLRRLGITDPRVVFHSLRNTVETQMIARGIPLERAQLIVGHERLGSSSPYVDRGSVQDEENRKAISKVSYGRPLDDFVATTGASIEMKAPARPRKERRTNPSVS